MGVSFFIKRWGNLDKNRGKGMNRMVEIKAGGMRCELMPGYGGCVAGLWLDGVAVLRSPGAARIASARQSGNFPLVPFSNRLADARLHWHGEDHVLAANFAPEPHAMHGLGWQRPWQVVQKDTASATLLLVHAPDAAWPFSFECTQAFVLQDNALKVELRFINTDGRPAPVGLGWHPYIVKRPGARVAFSAGGRWNNDARGLPRGRVVTQGLDAACDGLDINHVFDGVTHGATVTDEVLRVRVTSSLSRLVVSTHPGKDFIAIEPVSHITDAFNRAGDPALGTVVLGHGRAFAAQMVIEAVPAD